MMASRRVYEILILEYDKLARSEILHHDNSIVIPEWIRLLCCNPWHYRISGVPNEGFVSRSQPKNLDAEFDKVLGMDKLVDYRDTLQLILPHLVPGSNGCWTWRGPTRNSYGFVELSNLRWGFVHQLMYAIYSGMDIKNWNGFTIMIEHRKFGRRTNADHLCCNPRHWDMVDLEEIAKFNRERQLARRQRK